MSEHIKHDSHEFAVRHFFGIPILMERWAVPHWSDSPGRWQWTRWRLCRFGHVVYVNAKLMEMRK